MPHSADRATPDRHSPFAYSPGRFPRRLLLHLFHFRIYCPGPLQQSCSIAFAIRASPGPGIRRLPPPAAALPAAGAASGPDAFTGSAGIECLGPGSPAASPAAISGGITRLRAGVRLPPALSGPLGSARRLQAHLICRHRASAPARVGPPGRQIDAITPRSPGFWRHSSFVRFAFSHAASAPGRQYWASHLPPTSLLFASNTGFSILATPPEIRSRFANRRCCVR